MEENELKGMKLKLGFWIVAGEEEAGGGGEANLLSDVITLSSPIVNITCNNNKETNRYKDLT